ncbi:MAG: hypothetical protein JSV21_06425 [Nitrospirota bacterium]|nr:MAG: hypothetical protein JSV21_06425 [Nitrospirota bacterium]
MKKKEFEEALKEYQQKELERFDSSCRLTREYKTLPTESGFSFVVEGCDGFCPECQLVLKCETYDKIKDTWRMFYS